MDFDPLAYLGWREALIAIIVILVVYVVVAFLRIKRLWRQRVQPDASTHALRSAIAAYTTTQGPVAASDVSDFPWANAQTPTSTPAPKQPDTQEQTEAQAEPPNELLENELLQLRLEVGSLRAEVMRLREEQKRELTEIRSVQSISPLYSDAMQMAMQGHDAASVSQHCGISRAEAELVVALVRNRDH
jgi:hypothetical protein